MSIPVYRTIYIITFVDQLCCVNIHKRSRYSIRKKGASFSKANCFLIFRCKLDKQIVTCMVVEHRYNRPSSTLITSEKKTKLKPYWDSHTYSKCQNHTFINFKVAECFEQLTLFGKLVFFEKSLTSLFPEKVSICRKIPQPKFRSIFQTYQLCETKNDCKND